MVAIVINARLLCVSFANAADLFDDGRRQNGLPSAWDAVEPDGTFSEVNPVIPLWGFKDPVSCSILVKALGRVMKSPGVCTLWYRSSKPFDYLSLFRGYLWLTKLLCEEPQGNYYLEPPKSPGAVVLYVVHHTF